MLLFSIERDRDHWLIRDSYLPVLELEFSFCAPLILIYEYLNRPLPVRRSAVAYGKTQFSELKNSF